MRRFSQKNALVTLNEINITPLLDLAFVLLIIFVITTPLLEQSLDVNLPKGGRADRATLDRKDIRVVEISADGRFKLGGQPLTPDQIEARLAADQRQNPNLVVDLRADKRAPWDLVAGMLDRFERNGVTRIRPRTAPER
jgi:biopolymer transport protein ExbD